MTKVYRIGNEAGPDYKCMGCGLAKYRMWRMGASSCVELLCAVCAEVSQKEQIARYADFTQPHDPGIGDLVPARRDPEDAHWWGHTSGDVDWWYRLPQYQDAKRETELLRRERDWFLRESNHYAGRWLDASKELDATREALVEAFAGKPRLS